ncbi:MAG: recombinase RecT [Lawsonibacter sp.]|jgi:recombination protein RecT|nr:recombinase RecT [Lawsonibacter sp.]
MSNNMTNTIQRAASKSPATRPGAPIAGASRNPSAVLSAVMDGEGYRKRFDELLGKRSAQFVSSIISLVNATPELAKAAVEAPQTIIVAGLKAAMMDLPVENSLGYAYIVPFKNSVKDAQGNYTKRNEAAFILGWRGMLQLALRTGAYRTINVSDVREGELRSYNRLTEEVDIRWTEDEDERDKLPIVGWVGYYKLVNGSEKTIYMSRKAMEAHERRNRKGQYMTKGWREDFDGMAMKTMYRKLLGKYGLMSIEYQYRTDLAIVDMAQSRMDGAPVLPAGTLDDEDLLDGDIIDAATGEVISTEGQGA